MITISPWSGYCGVPKLNKISLPTYTCVFLYSIINNYTYVSVFCVCYGPSVYDTNGIMLSQVLLSFTSLDAS